MVTSTAGSTTQKFRLNDEGISLTNLSSGGGMALDVNASTPSSKFCQLGMNSNRTGHFDTLGNIVQSWASDSVAQVTFICGDDTVNKDNGKVAIFTQPNNSSGLQYRLIVNEDGLVGIGTTTPLNVLHLDSQGSSTTIQIDSDTESSIDFNDHGGSAIRYKIGTNITNNDSQFEIRNVTNTSSNVMIHSNGHISFNKTNTADTSGVGHVFRTDSAAPNMSNVMDTSVANNSTYHLYNLNSTNNAYRFYVQANGGVVNHSGNNINLSDERMKKNITNMGSVYENFKKFVFRDFNYISDESSEIKKHGVIAQEVETIDADLITENFKIDTDSEGNDIYRKGLKEEQFMMIGFKALQEAIAKIEVLETKVAALEAT